MPCHAVEADEDMVANLWGRWSVQFLNFMRVIVLFYGLLRVSFPLLAFGGLNVVSSMVA